MSEVLGKMEKPEASQFKKGRKLFFVPLIFLQMEEEPAFAELARRYWNEVEEQLTHLESHLSSIKKVYHELVSGKEGLKQIKEISAGSRRISGKLTEKGAALTEIEGGDILMEFMDWGRCLSSGLQSMSVFNQVYSSYEETGKKRNENIARRIDETLGEDEAAVLFMREGHRVQFPDDIQIFYVAPPSLDAIKRVMRDQAEPHSHDHGHEHHFPGEEAEEHEHKHEDGSVHSHAHTHEGEHEHEHTNSEEAHEHEHKHSDGSVHSHPHVHEGEHKHEHAEEDKKEDK
jgi:hypothetical protein